MKLKVSIDRGDQTLKILVARRATTVWKVARPHKSLVALLKSQHNQPLLIAFNRQARCHVRVTVRIVFIWASEGENVCKTEK